MRVNVIAVGKIKEKFLVEAISEYQKRLSKFVTLSVIEINDEKVYNESNENIIKAKTVEGQKILEKLNVIGDKNNFVVALDILGMELSTMEFYEKIKKLKDGGISCITFIIGGSYGLSDKVLNMSNFRLSFSKLTFPHMLFRVMLLEQIYRICKIENNEPYHK